MKIPILTEYGLEMLGASCDPAMITYWEPYPQHPEAVVREEAKKAIDQHLWNSWWSATSTREA